MDLKTIDFWKGWTRKTGALTWRLAVPDDLLAIRKLRNISHRLTGEPQRNPRLFSMPVLLTLVAEDETGKVVDCLYVEAIAELVKMGCGPDSFAEMAGLEEDLSMWLKSICIRTVIATSLPEHKERMTPGFLSLGFKCMDRTFAYFKRIL